MAHKEIILKNPQMDVKSAIVRIEGDGTLCLNQMNARNKRLLMSDDRKKIKEVPNEYEDLITAINWRDPLPMKDTYAESTKEMLDSLLTNNAPCISAFGLKKSFDQAVVRNEIDTYSTKFDNAVNVVAVNGKIPIEFAQWSVDERLMSPKKGAPLVVRLNHFDGWKASFRIDFTDHVYQLESILNIINLAGFGLGIGSGRTSGYGRYHIVGVEVIK